MFYKIMCFITVAFFTLTGFSQTTTINYLSSGLSTSACNVFSSSVNINGVQHYSHAGGVTFNTTNGIILTTVPTGSSAGGTAYIIQGNFTPNDKYDIAITAKGNNTLFLKTSVVPNLNQFATSGTNSCTPDPFVVGYNTTGYSQYVTVTSTSSVTYNIPQFTIAGSTTYSYLVIWATGGNPSLSLDALTISKVVITKTSTPTFTITPNTASIPCGSTTNKTFTVNNVYNSPGTLSYNWDLGSTNNGWIYQGSPAPQSFTTSQNNISLTSSSAASSYSNVAVTVVLNDSNYTTLTSNVTTTPLEHNMTITGANNICSSEIYTLNNIPSGGTIVSFTAFAPKFFISYTTSGNQITITRNGINSGVVDITAVVATNCGNITVSRTIYLGPIPATIIGPFDPVQHTIMTPCTGEQYYFSAYPIEGGATYSWEIIPPVTSSENPYFLYGSTAYVNFSDTAGCYTIKLLKSDACGGTAITQQTVCTQECFALKIATSPNPATSILTVTLTDGKEERTKQIKQENIQIELYNFNTGTKQKEWKYNTTTQRQFTVNITDITKGIYVVKVTKGKLQQVSKIIIE